jgi:hypothetical protein
MYVISLPPMYVIRLDLIEVDFMMVKKIMGRE